MTDPSKQLAQAIAEEIIERSPSVALRVTGENGKWSTVFITENISSYGYLKDDFLSGKISWMDLVHPEDQEMLVNTLNQHEADGINEYATVYRIVKADGEAVWITDNSNVIRNDDGEILYADCIISDYTDTKNNLERIVDNLRQQAVLNDILQGLHDYDLDRSLQIILDRTGEYLDISRVILFQDTPDHNQSRAIYEWCNAGIASMMKANDVFALNYLKDIPEILASLNETGTCIVNYGEIPAGSDAEFEQEGVIAAAIFRVYIQDEPFGFICFDECVKPRSWPEDTLAFLENIARLVSTALIRRKNEQVIQTMALTDQLTGLKNRYHLEARLHEAVESAEQKGESGYVLFIDMDDFKVINDGYGHDYGDIILKEFAAFLMANFSSSASIFRFGGDEFVILLEPHAAHSVYTIINSLLARAQLPWTVIDKNFYCTLSMGIVQFPEGSANTREIIKNADIAMYQAKRMGKNSYAFYSSSLDNESIARAEFEKAMRESIDNGYAGFSVLFQPLIKTNGVLIGAEALLRWVLPSGEEISPCQFIPLAEYLGLIIPVGEFVIRESALICREINSVYPDFFVSINISMRQFQQIDFLERVLSIIDETGVNPANIIFEITESLAMHDVQRVKTLSDGLRERGIRISMDDFGMGYSSLGNMRDLPIDIVKIDRTFIMDVTTDAYSKSFIRLISDLVHSMERKVCIEGVETSEQLAYCIECNADYVQGFFISPPLGKEELDVFIRESSIETAE